MDRATVFQPAIEYAEGGFPITINNDALLQVSEPRLRKWPTSREQYCPGRPHAAGGHDPHAAEPGAHLPHDRRGRRGGLLPGRDRQGDRPLLPGERRPHHRGGPRRFHAGVARADRVNYRGYESTARRRRAAACNTCITLNIVEGFDMAGMGQNSAPYIHHLAEAMKLAVADRAEYAPAPNAADGRAALEGVRRPAPRADRPASGGLQRRRALHLEEAAGRDPAGRSRTSCRRARRTSTPLMRRATRSRARRRSARASARASSSATPGSRSTTSPTGSTSIRRARTRIAPAQGRWRSACRRRRSGRTASSSW